MEDFFKVVFQKSTGLMGFAFRKEGSPWRERFYQYPGELDKAVAQCKEADSNGWDCYFVPSLLSKGNSKKESFKESNVVWVDYDKNESVIWVPEPTILVNTSDQRYHAYWLLDQPTQDVKLLESANKFLTLHHNGDESGWDATQLLRVPNTLSKKRDQPVTITHLNGHAYDIGSFPKVWDLLRKEVERLFFKHY